MTLRDFFDEVETRRRTITVFAPTSLSWVADRFESRHVDFAYEYLPAEEADPFLVVSEDDTLVGSVDLTAVEEMSAPTVPAPGSSAFAEAVYRKHSESAPRLDRGGESRKLYDRFAPFSTRDRPRGQPGRKHGSCTNSRRPERRVPERLSNTVGPGRSDPSQRGKTPVETGTAVLLRCKSCRRSRKPRGLTPRQVHRIFLSLLPDTLFSSLDRRQLLAAAREIEDRAYKTGRGGLYAGFQSFSAFRTQRSVYENLARETDLRIHVYGVPDWTPPSILGVDYYASSGGNAESTGTESFDESARADGELGRFWFVVFDGGDVELRSCALLAEERTPGAFYGFWTYDAELVERLASYLRATYPVGGDGAHYESETP